MTTPDPSQNGQAPAQPPQPSSGAAIEALKTRIASLREQLKTQVGAAEDNIDYINAMFMTAQGEVVRLSEENSRLLSQNDQQGARVTSLERKVRDLGGDPDQVDSETEISEADKADEEPAST